MQTSRRIDRVILSSEFLRDTKPSEVTKMLRYTTLIISALFFISTAASAQPSFQITIGNNPMGGQIPPPGSYFCQPHNQYCSHPQNQGYYNGNQGYYNGNQNCNDDYGYNNNGNRRWNKKQQRRYQKAVRRNNRHARSHQQGPPPGHYYCQQHRVYCSH